MTNIVVFHVILQKVASFVEQTEGDDSLHDTNTLSSKDTSETKGGHVSKHFLDGFGNGIRLALDGRRLHDNFQT